MLVLCFYCLFNSFCELLDIFNLLCVLNFYFLDYFERSVLLAEYLEYFLLVAQMVLLFNLHAVVASFGTFHVKVDCAFRSTALHTRTNVAALLAANDATKRKPLKIKFIHSYWSSRSDIRSLHPHRAAVVNPVI